MWFSPAKRCMAACERLRNVSIITLGVTALTPALLVGTFIALIKRISTLQSQIADLQTMFAAAKQAQLQTGLELLKLGQASLRSSDPSKTRNLLGDALPLCLESVKYYGNLLGPNEV